MAENSLTCQVAYAHTNPCGRLIYIHGEGGAVVTTWSAGRPDRCEWLRGPDKTYNECKELCEMFNRRPPSGYASLPCAGFETTATDYETSQGYCNLIRSPRTGGTDMQCPGAARFWNVVSAAGPVKNASEICRYYSDSRGNPDMPEWTCFAVFDNRTHSTCPEILNCPPVDGGWR